MEYKTITLELLQRHADLHDLLRKNRELLPAMETCAAALKARHETLKNQLAATNPDAHASQTASAAMAIAVQELEHRLQTAFPPDGQGTLSLDAGMAFLRNLTPHG